MRSINRKLLFLILSSLVLFAKEPITPIPKVVKYDLKKALLGKELFEETGLSKNGEIACVSCHNYNHGGAENKKIAIGADRFRSRSNTPTVFNAYFNFRQLWNGKAEDLKEQLIELLKDLKEMGLKPKDMEKFLKNSKKYKKRFFEVYGKRPSIDLMIDAIVEFEKALYTPDSRFDRFLRGEIKLSGKEKRGYRLFKRYGCITCHTGVNVGGNSFQKAGLIVSIPWNKKNPDRYSYTKDERDKNVYKVPTLRNIALTAPYLHNGSFDNLEDAVIAIAYINIGVHIRKEDAEDIVAFLKSLTGKMPEILQKSKK